MREEFYVVKYEHRDCEIDPGVQWCDLWSCACNGECPACGMTDIEPVDWRKASELFDRSAGGPERIDP